jgi:hypothetical protein
VNGRRGEQDLTVLIERSVELKRDLVGFACSPRLERSLAAAMLDADLDEPEEADAINTIDRFALQYQLPDGKTVVDRFAASRPDLDAENREMLLGWRDPVEGEDRAGLAACARFHKALPRKRPAYLTGGDGCGCGHAVIPGPSVQ